jgi:hypothetical protein
VKIRQILVYFSNKIEYISTGRKQILPEFFLSPGIPTLAVTGSQYRHSFLKGQLSKILQHQLFVPKIKKSVVLKNAGRKNLIFGMFDLVLL